MGTEVERYLAEADRLLREVDRNVWELASALSQLRARCRAERVPWTRLVSDRLPIGVRYAQMLARVVDEGVPRAFVEEHGPWMAITAAQVRQRERGLVMALAKRGASETVVERALGRKTRTSVRYEDEALSRTRALKLSLGRRAA